jgi:hypothetical protein
MAQEHKFTKLELSVTRDSNSILIEKILLQDTIINEQFLIIENKEDVICNQNEIIKQREMEIDVLDENEKKLKTQIIRERAATVVVIITLVLIKIFL